MGGISPYREKDNFCRGFFLTMRGKLVAVPPLGTDYYFKPISTLQVVTSAIRSGTAVLLR